ncbi:MAG TPA: hypothetical protein VHW09_23015 [Bryobacteraceae bacterium]|jgi:uncharacterized protein (TIGR03437 family)|nr:hypothetical protein [Bryobacteraceae bacterium]
MKFAIVSLVLCGAVLLAQPTSCQIQTVAGAPNTFSPDGTPALQTRLATVNGVAVDSKGVIYFSDTTNHRVRKIASDGTVVTVAGTGVPGFSGDGAPAISAQLQTPGALVFDAKGNLYIADTANFRVREVTPDGLITTFAGNGGNADLGDGGLAINASFRSLLDITFGPDGSLYILDSSARRVRKIAQNVISAFAGGVAGAPLDLQSPIYHATGIALDRNGNLYVAAGKITRITPGGAVTAIAGLGSTIGDGGAALTTLMNAAKLAIDSSGDVYFYDSETGMPDPNYYRLTYLSAVRMIDTAGTVHHVANIVNVSQLAITATGAVAAATGTVQSLAATGSATVLAGMPDFSYSGDNGPATSASLHIPAGLAFSPSGTLYFSDPGNHAVRAIDSYGVLTTVVGNGVGGRVSVKPVPATGATLDGPQGLAVDKMGNLYVVDFIGVIYKVTPQGTIQLYAGGGSGTFIGYTVPATSVFMIEPSQVAVDSAGNLYYLENSHVLMKVSAVDQTVSEGPDLSPHFPSPPYAFVGSDSAFTIDAHDNIYLVYTDLSGKRVVGKIAPDGTSTVIKSIASVPFTQAIAVDSAGNIYLSNAAGIHKYAPDGTLLTVTGSYTAVDILADGPASQAVSSSAYMAMGPDGDLYYADGYYNRVRRLTVGGCVTGPQPILESVVNAGSFSSDGTAAPGEIVSLFGLSLGPAAGLTGQFDSTGVITSSLAGVSVLFNGQPAPLFYAGADQINVQVPLETAIDSYALVRVLYNGLSSDLAEINIQSASPGIFGSVVSAGRVAAILNADGSVNSAANPAVRGTVVSMYATGGGLTDPVQADGVPPPAAANLLLPAAISIHGIAASVSYAGASPWLVGATQVNFQVPADPQVVSGYNVLTFSVGGPANSDTSGIFVK